MLADEELSEFVQQIGLASLGASDKDVQRLINLYFYSVEHGLKLTYLGHRRVYGARVLSNLAEIQHAMSEKIDFQYFDPFEASNVKYTRKSLQPVYWFSSDFRESKDLLRKFAQTLERPFWVDYNPRTEQLNFGWRHDS